MMSTLHFWWIPMHSSLLSAQKRDSEISKITIFQTSVSLTLPCVLLNKSLTQIWFCLEYGNVGGSVPRQEMDFENNRELLINYFSEISKMKGWTIPREHWALHGYWHTGILGYFRRGCTLVSEKGEDTYLSSNEPKTKEIESRRFEYLPIVPLPACL